MIKVLIGNMFESQARTLVNTVNCVGVMGKGVAAEFKKRFPDMFKEYKAKCDAKQVLPGTPYFFGDFFGQSVVNFPTKSHWRSPSKLDDVVNGLERFTKNYKSWGIESVAFPPLGCGNGGLDWDIVGPLMYQTLSKLDIDVEIYAPFGTSLEKLKEEFLLRNVKTKSGVKGSVSKIFKKEWIALLETLWQLQNEMYAKPVGRTIFQKICYTLTEQGVDTGFSFKQGSYGPFSKEVKDALHLFANSNLTQESNLGRMTALKVTDKYTEFREKYLDSLKLLEKKISKTVDLFSRIKDTTQAEEVATVFYATRKVKESQTEVTEDDIYKYVIDWKKHWDNTEKRTNIANAIRNLVMLKWVDVKFSDSLPIEDLEF